MKVKSYNRFDVERYVESVARFRAGKALRRHGQSRADYVYQKYIEIGLNLWQDLRQTLPEVDAAIWFPKLFGNQPKFSPAKTSENLISETGLKPGAECYAKSVIDEYKSILKKVADFEHGTKSESNRKRVLKNAVNEAMNFVKVEPSIYRAERHGSWLSKSTFDSMLRKCKEIIAKYAAVSTMVCAA